MFYIWVPLFILYMIGYGWLSIQNNQSDSIWYTSGWFWALFFYNIFPFWLIISRSSTNLVFDGMLYDVLVFTVFTAILITLGKATFNVYQWMGVVAVCIGFFLMHVDKDVIALLK